MRTFLDELISQNTCNKKCTCRRCQFLKNYNHDVYETGNLLHMGKENLEFEFNPNDSNTYSTFVNNVVFIAKDEFVNWWKRGSVSEKDEDGKYCLTFYWDAVPSNRKRTTTAKLVNDLDAWSAAFISWVIKTAGAGKSFLYSGSHAQYIRDAKKAKGKDYNKAYWLYDVAVRQPQIGDIICNSRNNSGLNFENADDGKDRFAHCDIVVEVFDDKIYVIGGNSGPKSNTVFQRTRYLKNGLIDKSRNRIDGGEIFGIMSVL